MEKCFDGEKKKNNKSKKKQAGKFVNSSHLHHESKGQSNYVLR